MRLITRITIGGNPTEEFLSSEITFINNVYVTLRISGVNDDICRRVYDAMLAGDIGQFRFQEPGVAIFADQIPSDSQESQNAAAELFSPSSS